MTQTLTLGNKISSGRTAEIYSYSSDTVIKLFLPQFGIKIAEVEYSLHKSLYETGLPIPKIFDFIEFEKRGAIVYQKLEGESLLDSLKKSPQNIKGFACDMADLHYDISKVEAPNGFPTFKDKILSGIKSQDLLDEKKTAAVIDMLESLPSGKSVCHADFHPDNILICDGKYWIIDWMTACSGSFEADYTRTDMILNHSESPNAKLYEKILTKTFGGLFSKLYTGKLIKNGLNLSETVKWKIPIMTARLAENVSLNENNTLLKIINRTLI